MQTLLEEKEKRTAPLGLRLTPTLRRAIEKAASEDSRTLASYVEKVLTDHLRASGHLPSGDPEAASAIIDGLERGRKLAESGE